MTLDWIDDRWHLDGQPVHAGAAMDVCWPDGTWETVRVESADRGHKLLATFDYHGLALCVRIWPDPDIEFRWPENHSSLRGVGVGANCGDYSL